MGRKRIVLLLVLLLTFALCPACTIPTVQQKEGTSEESSEEADSQEKLEFKVFVPYAEANVDSVATGFVKAVEQAEEAFPDYTIDVEYVNTETYKKKLKIYAASNELPDIFFSWSDAYLQPLLEDGQVLRLNDYLPEGADAGDDRYAAFSEDGDIYGMVTTEWYGVFFCNVEKFEECGLSLPKTWEDLLEAVAVFRENGINPLVCGLKDSWPAHLYVNALLLQLAGSQKYAAYARGSESCSYETMQIIGERLEELIQAGAFQSRSETVNYDDACRMFANGEAAMYFGSNVEAGTIEGIMDASQVATLRLPLISECRYPNSLLGKASNGFCVAAATPYPQEACELAYYLTQHTATNSGRMSSWADYDLFEEASLENKIRSLVEESEEFGNNYDVLLDEDRKQGFLDVTVSLFEGELSSQEFAEQIVQVLNGQAD